MSPNSPYEKGRDNLEAGKYVHAHIPISLASTLTKFHHPLFLQWFYEHATIYQNVQLNTNFKSNYTWEHYQIVNKLFAVFLQI